MKDLCDQTQELEQPLFALCVDVAVLQRLVLEGMKLLCHLLFFLLLLLDSSVFPFVISFSHSFLITSSSPSLHLTPFCFLDAFQFVLHYGGVYFHAINFSSVFTGREQKWHLLSLLPNCLCPTRNNGIFIVASLSEVTEGSL